MRIKSCLYFLGLSCLPIFLLSLLNIFYSIYFDYSENIKSYFIVLLSSLIIGFIFFKIGQKFKDNITIYEQIFLVILIYFFIPIFFSIPFYLSDYNLTFTNSYFESISGLTGTGFSIISDITNLDPPLILWRSSSQWVGGFYFLIFLILIFSNKQIDTKFINYSFNLENKLNFASNLHTASIKIFFIYFILTIFIFSIFSISGIRLFNSFNLSMTIISSGGFLPTNSLNDIIITNFQSLSLIFSFLISILNFYLFYNLFLARNNIKHHKEEIYILLSIIIFFVIFYFTNKMDLLSVLLNVLSSIGTSGITTDTVPDNFGLYFLLLTLFGGSVLSNTSGIKFLRFYILLKAFFIEMYKLVKPNFILNTNIMYSQNKINSENIRMSFLIFIFFFLSLFVLSSLLLTDTLGFENSFKLGILTLTNTTTSNIYGIEGIDFENLFIFSKISLIMFMVVAKVELLSVFVLIQRIFFRN